MGIVGEETQYFGLFSREDLRQITLMQWILIIGSTYATFVTFGNLRKSFEKNYDNMRAARLVLERNHSHFPFKTDHLDVPSILKLDTKGL